MVDPQAKSLIARALSVLDSFDAGHRRQSLAAISRRTGLPLTTVHRMVHELERNSALVRSPDGNYEIGSRIWRLGILASVHADLREVALPYMEDVYELTAAAVQIAVLDGLRCLVVERIAGSRTMSVLSKPGSRLPLHATGVGKVLLAMGSQELQDAVLGSLDRYTDRTITDADTLRAQLVQIKSQGFAHTREELADGATSIAVPLKGKGGRVIAALGIVSPSEGPEVSRMVPVMQVAAAALSRKLVESGLGVASRLQGD
ncbi:MAG: IclR family transcriptional regulator [Rhodoglobus sp.]